MTQEIKLPGVGGVSKRALVIGGATAALVMGFLWWRKRNAGTATPTGTTGADTSGVDTAGDIVSGLGSGGTTTSDTATNTTPATNADWTTLVMDRLGGVVDLGALSAALGLYLTGAAVDSTQEGLIDQAIAVAGYPPVHGPNEYPPGIRHQPGTGQTTPTRVQRKDQPDNAVALRIGYATGTWEQIVRAHYIITNLTQAQIGTAAWVLAHDNGYSGSTDPHKQKIQVTLPQYLNL